MSNRMQVFIYIRVSTQEQARDGVSIGTQRTRLTAFAQSQDWDIHDFYIDDGQSAKDLNRDDLQRMLEDIEKIDGEKVILVYKLDRLTRSVQDLYDLLKTFDKSNTAFRSASEVFDTTTAMGRLFITMVAAMAQWERETVSERVALNMEQMVMDGKWHGGTVALGYKWEGKQLQIEDREALIVKKIFKMYNSGEYGIRNLARWLNNHGYKSKRGGHFSYQTLTYLLKNPIYIGHLQWHLDSDKYFTVGGVAPPILDKETFDFAQKLFDSRKNLHPRQATSDFIFSGRLRCGRCGGPLAGKVNHKPSRTYYNYICNNKQNGTCDLPYINQDLLEKNFLKYIVDIRDSDAAAEAAATTHPNDNNNELKAMQRELKQLKGRRRKWQLAYGDGTITLDDLRELTAEDKQREQEIRAQIEEYETDDIPNYDPDEIKQILEDFPLQWKYANLKEKKMMVQMLVKSIEIDTPFNKMPVNRKKQKLDIKEIQWN